MRNALDKWEDGIAIGGKYHNNRIYEIMWPSWQRHMAISATSKLISLGVSLNENGNTIKDANTRIAIQKKTTGDLQRVWSTNSLVILFILKRKDVGWLRDGSTESQCRT